METPVDGVQSALTELQASVQQRASAVEASKQAALQERKENQDLDAEKRPPSRNSPWRKGGMRESLDG